MAIFSVRVSYLVEILGLLKLLVLNFKDLLSKVLSEEFFGIKRRLLR